MQKDRCNIYGNLGALDGTNIEEAYKILIDRIYDKIKIAKAEINGRNTITLPDTSIIDIAKPEKKKQHLDQKCCS